MSSKEEQFDSDSQEQSLEGADTVSPWQRFAAIIIFVVFICGSFFVWLLLQPSDKSALDNSSTGSIHKSADKTAAADATIKWQAREEHKKQQWALMSTAPASSVISGTGVLTDSDMKSLANDLRKRSDGMTLINVHDNPEITNVGLGYLRDLPTEKLYAAGTHTDSSVFAHGWTNLKLLDISHTAAEKSFAALANPPLMALGLADDELADKDIDTISKFGKLNSLVLSHNKITAAGLNKLAKLSQLKSLDVTGNPISVEALNQFKKARPDCSLQF
ncbi:MAG TPA: hypothetical protein V6C81_09070 [Planktothrix sp.]|jgi:Leucine-rich repeat (LRR) protein